MKELFKKLAFFGLLCCVFFNSSCKKLVDIPQPSTAISSLDVFDDDQTAIAVQTGVYENIMNINSITGGGLIDMSFYPALSADELTLWPGNSNDQYNVYYTNSLNNQNTSYTDFWNNIYPIIYVCNSSIAGLNNSTGLTPGVKQQLLGEAEFMRALCYFYLVNLYGDVPLVLGTEYTQNSHVGRTAQAQVWDQIIVDLKSARELLSGRYLDGTLANSVLVRVRPTTWAAAALLARAYLYTGQWANAIQAADTVINNRSMFQLGGLDQVFLATSSEAIWQLQPVSSGWNTPDAQIFVIPGTGPNSQWPVYLSNNILNSFEPGDGRRIAWVDSVQALGSTYYYPYKYKVNTYDLNGGVSEYEMVLRLGEQFLIRAEAEAQTNDLADAASDINAIRARAGLGILPDSIVQNQVNLLSAIQHERQVELFTEWGHRWLDLKRTNTLNTVMGAPGNVYYEKTGQNSWNPNWAFYPISLTQLQMDPSLNQNDGY